MKVPFYRVFLIVFVCVPPLRLSPFFLLAPRSPCTPLDVYTLYAFTHTHNTHGAHDCKEQHCDSLTTLHSQSSLTQAPPFLRALARSLTDRCAESFLPSFFLSLPHSLTQQESLSACVLVCVCSTELGGRAFQFVILTCAFVLFFPRLFTSQIRVIGPGFFLVTFDRRSSSQLASRSVSQKDSQPASQSVNTFPATMRLKYVT